LSQMAKSRAKQGI